MWAGSSTTRRALVLSAAAALGLVLSVADARPTAPELALRTVKLKGFTALSRIEDWAVLKPSVSVVLASDASSPERLMLFKLKPTGKTAPAQALVDGPVAGAALLWPVGGQRSSVARGLAIAARYADDSIELNAGVLLGSGRVKGLREVYSQPAAARYIFQGGMRAAVSGDRAGVLLAYAEQIGSDFSRYEVRAKLLELEGNGRVVAEAELEMPAEADAISLWPLTLSATGDGWLVVMEERPRNTAASTAPSRLLTWVVPRPAARAAPVAMKVFDAPSVPSGAVTVRFASAQVLDDGDGATALAFRRLVTWTPEQQRVRRTFRDESQRFVRGVAANGAATGATTTVPLDAWPKVAQILANPNRAIDTYGEQDSRWVDRAAGHRAFASGRYATWSQAFVTGFEDPEQQFSLYDVDSVTGEVTLLARADAGGERWYILHAGAQRLGSRTAVLFHLRGYFDENVRLLYGFH